MTRLLWLPTVLRAAGLTVHEVDGWETRGSSTYDPKGIICHATAGSATSTDAGEIRVLLNGSNTAPPPIAQLYLSRTGAFHVVASGKCFHALTGWGGPLKGLGNTNLIGIEAQNDNRGQPWPALQVDAYERGVAAICQRMGWTAGRNVAAHREHQPYPPPSWTTSSKSDPHGIDMTKFRARVTAILAGEDDIVTPEDIEKIATATKQKVLSDGGMQMLFTRVYQLGVNLAAVQTTVGKLPAVVGAEGTNPTELAAALAALPKLDQTALAATVAEQVIAALPDGGEPVSREDLEAALRSVLGSLDATQ